MFAPSLVKGSSKNYFYKMLAERIEEEPSWNFNKYLISRYQKSTEHFSSGIQPLDCSLERLNVSLLDVK